MMQKSYIILDAMSTGNIPEIRGYLNYFDHANISLETSDHYFEYESVPLDLYSYRYVMIDTYFVNRFDLRQEYKNDLARRITALDKLNFIPVFANLWERHNFKNSKTETLALFQHMLQKSNSSRYGELHGSRSFFWWLMYEKYIKSGLIDYLKIDHSIKSYDFLYLNKQPRAHRIHLYNQMLAIDALKKSLYTYRNDHHCHYGREIRIEKINKSLPPQYEIPEFKDDYPQYGYDQQIYPQPYNHSRINLVTETLADDPNSGGYPYFLTEKIWKPIICQQPFIVYGQRGYLKCLREMGFKTFSNIWDESYDDEKDWLKRGNMIANLARSLLDMDSEKLYLDTMDVRSHNLKIFSDKKILKSIITQDVSNSLFRDLIKI
jgi:hypothetical protein